MIISATGHRMGPKVGGFQEEVWKLMTKMAEEALQELQPELVITGMAIGWDQAVAQACVNLGQKFHAYVPFSGQEGRWPQKIQEKYHSLLKQAEEVKYITKGAYAPWKMQARNEQMVEDGDVILALWDGSKGGTYNAVKYSERKKKMVLNLWKEYQERLQQEVTL